MSKIKPIPEREPAHDIFRRRHHPLDGFFSPRTVALIGATESEGSVGRTILQSSQLICGSGETETEYIRFRISGICEAGLRGGPEYSESYYKYLDGDRPGMGL